MNKTLLLVIAVVAGIAAMVLVQRHIDNLVGETVTVFKATRDIPAGSPVGSAYAAITLPAGLFPDILEEAPNEDLQAYIESTPLRAPVSTDDILLYRHFDASIDQGVLPAIPPGKKAISIPVSETASVSYFIQPGDLVDVFGTFREQEEANVDPGFERRTMVSTRPILQAAEILAVGGDYRRTERQQRAPYGTVTLLVTIEEAAKLIFAQDFYSATLTLVLRSQNDAAVSEELTTISVDTRNFDEIGNEPSLGD